jgi:hypothetical protein
MTSHHGVFLSSDITTHCHSHLVMVTWWDLSIQWRHNTLPFSFTNVTRWDLFIQWRHNMGRWPLVLETPHKFQRMRRRLLLRPVLFNFFTAKFNKLARLSLFTTFTLVYRVLPYHRLACSLYVVKLYSNAKRTSLLLFKIVNYGSKNILL